MRQVPVDKVRGNESWGISVFDHDKYYPTIYQDEKRSFEWSLFIPLDNEEIRKTITHYATRHIQEQQMKKVLGDRHGKHIEGTSEPPSDLVTGDLLIIVSEGRNLAPKREVALLRI